ncbi:molybdenum cofactor biosynthesis protein MoaE [Microvirga tunisiensis]|uniref:Molybdopterin synthase catalytic subunit n=1 Tax=Microvirga tunisiensis TaxID=2108360 RepID=A0A5N7MAQ5_9HYPH|nr:molybdenum cofactor biosynthesis protein MoaE [Microvirga tunisiensis]MPR05519.1 molybdopterin synthase catalytic subunit [Microvirga tunisiensis]MPR23720.1 molybdopterin synthase catalytic subunit [Microvirga tunisiensis]
MAAIIRIQAEPFQMAAETAAMTEGRADIGALVAFTGLCRDEGGRLSALEIEHYPGMVKTEIARIAGQAESRWPLLGLTVIHRFGKISPGEEIVLILAASAHRRPAFEAAEFLMDYLKTHAPFWKREHLKDGTVGAWVEAKELDDQAAERWNQSGLSVSL